MIVDRNQFNRFVAILPELQNDEVYFVSLSARNKYLAKEERTHYSLGRTEMFSREIARDTEGLYYAMKKLRASLQYRRTNNGLEIPEKCLVVYANVNPSSMIKAYQAFANEMSHEIGDITLASLNRKEPNFEGVKRMNRLLMTSIQRSRGRKYFIDIDLDMIQDTSESQKDFVQLNFQDFMKERGMIYYKIYSRSGCHYLIRKETVTGELYKHVEFVRNQPGVKEIEFNSNEMVPVPGTMQAEKMVTIEYSA